MDKYAIGHDISGRFYEIYDSNDDNIYDIKDLLNMDFMFLMFDDDSSCDDIEHEEVITGNDIEEILSYTMYGSFLYNVEEMSQEFETGGYMLLERIGKNKVKIINYSTYKSIFEKYLINYNKAKEFFYGLNKYVTQYATLTLTFDVDDSTKVEIINKNVDDIEEIKEKFEKEDLYIENFDNGDLIFSHNIEFLIKEVIFELPYSITMGAVLRTTLKDSDFNKIHGYALYIDNDDELQIIKSNAEEIKNSFNNVHEKEIYCGENEDDIILGFDLI